MVETASNALSMLRVLHASFVKLVFIDPPNARRHLSLPGQPKVLYTREYTMTEENKHWRRRKFWDLSLPIWEPSSLYCEQKAWAVWATGLWALLCGKSCIPPFQESFLNLYHSCGTAQTDAAIDTVLSEMEHGTTHYQNIICLLIFLLFLLFYVTLTFFIILNSLYSCFFSI